MIIATLCLGIAMQVKWVAGSMPMWATQKPERTGWIDAHRMHTAEIQGATDPIDFVLYGDSITAFHSGIVVSDRVGGTSSVWDEIYADMHAIPAGIPGDRVGQVRWRLDRGESPETDPSVVGLLVGINDLLWGDPGAPDVVTVQYAELLDHILETMPTSRVLVIALLPTKWKNTSRFNRRLFALVEAAYPGVDVVDCGAGLSASSDLFADGIHPSAAGHAVIHACISDKVRSMLPARPSVPPVEAPADPPVEAAVDPGGQLTNDAPVVSVAMIFILLCAM